METKNNSEKGKKSDVLSLERSVEMLKKHIEKNKHDFKTKRALLIKEARLKKLSSL